jgi:hypothetical protein
VQLLAAVSLAGHRVCLPAGSDHAAAHAQLTALLAQAAGPETAGLFAEPRSGPSEIEYVAPDGRVARYDELDAGGRTALRAEIGRLASLLRQAAERAAQRDPVRCGNWPALAAGAIEIPTFELVYAREGRPVLAGWGLCPAAAPMGLGLIRALDDGRGLEPRLVFPIWAAVLSLLALLAIGAMAALAAPVLIALFDPPEAVCRVAPADQQAFLELDSERKREQELRRSLASVQQAGGEKRAACPIPTVPAIPPPAKAQPALPADRWNNKDLSMLAGCWQLGKETVARMGLPGGNKEMCRVSAGKICFDGNGNGTREMTDICPSTGKIECRAPITASFGADGNVHTRQPMVNCKPTSTWFAEPNFLNCRRVSDDHASCKDNLGFDHEFRRLHE